MKPLFKCVILYDCYANILMATSVSQIHIGQAPMNSRVLTAREDVPVATYTL